MIDAGDRITGFDYQWGGGHADPAQSDSQTDPQPQGGTEPGQNGTPGYDCSGSTDYVLWGGGYGQSILGGSDPASGELMQLGDAGRRQVGRRGTRRRGTCSSRSPESCLTPCRARRPSSRPAHRQPGHGGPARSQITYEFTYDGAFVPRHPPGL